MSGKARLRDDLRSPAARRSLDYHSCKGQLPLHIYIFYDILTIFLRYFYDLRTILLRFEAALVIPMRCDLSVLEAEDVVESYMLARSNTELALFDKNKIKK